MSTEQWSADQLGALADEWAAEREVLPRSRADVSPQRNCHRALLANSSSWSRRCTMLSWQLSVRVSAASCIPWTAPPRYTIQHRVAEYPAGLETQYGAAADADAARRLYAAPSRHRRLPRHDAIRQALAIMQHILHLYKELRGQFDFATIRFANRLASQIKIASTPCTGGASIVALLALGQRGGGSL